MSNIWRGLTTALVFLLLAGCTSGDTSSDAANDPTAGSAIDVATLQIGDPVEVAEYNPTSFNLTDHGGGGWVMWDSRTGELCRHQISGDSETQDCVDVDSVETVQTGAWAPDGDRLLITNRFTSSLEDPDVSVVDFSQGTVDVLNDDGIDSIQDRNASVDFAPFFGPDGDVHFFSTDVGGGVGGVPLTEVMVLDDDGRVERLDIDISGVRPSSPVLDLGNGRYVFMGDRFGGEEVFWSKLFVLDLTTATAEEEAIPPFEGTFLLAAKAGVAVTQDVRALRRGLSPIELVAIEVATGQRTVIGQDDLGGEAVADDDGDVIPLGRPLAAISPSGSTLLVGFYEGESEEIPIYAFERDDRGEFVNGTLVTADIAPGYRGDSAIRGFRMHEMIWTQDNTLLAVTADNRVVSFPVTSS